MPQWEYRLENFMDGRPIEISKEKPLDHQRLLDLVNDLGAAGWEMVAFLPPAYGEKVVFKRQKN